MQVFLACLVPATATSTEPGRMDTVRPQRIDAPHARRPACGRARPGRLLATGWKRDLRGPQEARGTRPRPGVRRQGRQAKADRLRHHACGPARPEGLAAHRQRAADPRLRGAGQGVLRRSSRADLLAAIESLREWDEAVAAVTLALCREYLEGEGPFPERLPWLILAGKFLDEFHRAVDRWAEWAEGSSSSGRTTFEAPSPTGKRSRRWRRAVRPVVRRSRQQRRGATVP
jgi:hypothetical protein